MSDRVSRVQAAVEAVRLACQVTRLVQRDLSPASRLTKKDDSPVTVADLAAQAVIAHTLRARLGKATLVGEETASMLRDEMAAGRGGVADAVLQAARTVWSGATLDDVLDAIDLGAADPPTDSTHGFWTVDPIDGTKGFLRGEQYSVCLAWIEHGAPVHGVVGCPNLSMDLSRPLDEPDPAGVIYAASAGEGLYETSAGPDDAPLRAYRRLPAADGEPIRLAESADSASDRVDEAERVMALVGELAEPQRVDGQVKYVLVARGQADAYMRLPRKGGHVEWIWDHAAGALLVREAGCEVSDISGRELDFSQGRRLARNRGIIAAPTVLHGRIVEAARVVERGIGA